MSQSQSIRKDPGFGMPGEVTLDGASYISFATFAYRAQFREHLSRMLPGTVAVHERTPAGGYAMYIRREGDGPPVWLTDPDTDA
jgi:hypothetical protein